MGEALTKEYVRFISEAHNNSDGWIARAEIKDKQFKQWLYKYQDLVEQEYEADNVYMTRNTFKAPFRRIEYLKELKRLYIDLDTYNTSFTNTQILMHLEAEYFNKSIPRPNQIIDSGRGMYLEWTIKATPSSYLPMWKALQDHLWNVLKPFGADRQALDPTRVLRVPGSFNSKSNKVVSIIEQWEYEYDLEEIAEEYIPEPKEKKVQPKTKKKDNVKKLSDKLYAIQMEKSLYQARLQDIIKLCELRNYDVYGHREFILFLYRYYLCYFAEDVQKALEDTLELNNTFRYPLSLNEAKKATESAEKEFLGGIKKYNYTNSSLIKLLEITELEETYMSTIISKREYKRRDRVYQKNKYQEKLKSEGKISEKEKISQRRAKIKDLFAEGLKQKDIYLLLNISKRTCINDIKYLKEQGLI